MHSSLNASQSQGHLASFGFPLAAIHPSIRPSINPPRSPPDLGRGTPPRRRCSYELTSSCLVHSSLIPSLRATCNHQSIHPSILRSSGLLALRKLRSKAAAAARLAKPPESLIHCQRQPEQRRKKAQAKPKQRQRQRKAKAKKGKGQNEGQTKANGDS